jgi:hypothetical protein
MKLWKYLHYKNLEYEVIWVAKHSETLEELVVYKALYWEQKLWIRPRKMFEENIIVDWKKIRRFKYIWDKK